MTHSFHFSNAIIFKKNTLFFRVIIGVFNKGTLLENKGTLLENKGALLGNKEGLLEDKEAVLSLPNAKRQIRKKHRPYYIYNNYKG